MANNKMKAKNRFASSLCTALIIIIVGCQKAPVHVINLKQPHIVAVDSIGNAYVVDYSSYQATLPNVVLKLAPDDKMVKRFDVPASVADIDVSGKEIFVLGVPDLPNLLWSILDLSPNGKLIKIVKNFDPPGKIGENSLTANKMTVSKNKTIYVAATDANDNHFILKIDDEGTVKKQWALNPFEGRQFDVTGLASDNSDNVYVLSNVRDRPESVSQFVISRIIKYDNDGNKLFSFSGKLGEGNGQFSFPNDIAVDRFGNIYIDDPNRIQKFDRRGNFITKWGDERIFGSTEEGGPDSIAINRESYLYAVDSTHQKIYKFTLDGKLVATWKGAKK